MRGISKTVDIEDDLMDYDRQFLNVSIKSVNELLIRHHHHDSFVRIVA